ncbi:MULTISPECIES: hypothetical protein [Lactobacillus]|uniref:Uncharacterized protein n=1 Tax=Lactobacillus delbrueckii TaxID=1584 RepID=A0ABD0AH29_9LACO|nr:MULTISPECIES: hypothetical protein [Lactobacillus]MCD5535893.1 hypothetical protein [Lactobacillus delbrueckii subsp. sunkii]GHN18930.1 hypothetical protein ME783_14720 [Lactobacillus delbrueckii]GHN34304.1 hypothetical protein ME791_14560 [Lactobacillus delbrueckii]GHN42247.1 hypothetical protein ME796_15960 [Lactobacillus delbrueckii]
MAEVAAGRVQLLDKTGFDHGSWISLSKKNKNNSPKWNIGHKEHKKNYVKNERDLITVPGQKK